MRADQLFHVKDHVVIVTGAASGLGLAMAEVMAENGARVVLLDIDAAGLERSTSRLRASGCAVEPMTVDVRDTSALRSAIDGTAANGLAMTEIDLRFGGSPAVRTTGKAIQ